MTIKAKPFKTWDEQVDILNEWGNKFIKNKKQRDKILEYLKKYNFQVFVDAFTPLLWQHFEDGITEQNPKFIKSFEFNNLIQLFDFDNYLKNRISDMLEELEKRLKK